MAYHRNITERNRMKKKIITMVSILLLMSVSCIVCLNTVKADDIIWINVRFSLNYGAPMVGYLLVNMTITNNGYSSFDLNPAYFILNESSDQYPTNTLSYFTIIGFNDWHYGTLNNGSTFSGALAYLYNPSVNDLSLEEWYNGTTSTGQGYTIVWNQTAYLPYQSSYSYITYSGPTPTPIGTSTPTPTPIPTTASNSTPATPEFPTMAIFGVYWVLALLAVVILKAKKARDKQKIEL